MMSNHIGIMLDIGPLGVIIPVEKSGILQCIICNIYLDDENSSGHEMYITPTLTQEACQDCWEEYGPKEDDEEPCNCGCCNPEMN